MEKGYKLRVTSYRLLEFIGLLELFGLLGILEKNRLQVMDYKLRVKRPGMVKC